MQPADAANESAAAFCLLFHQKAPCWGRKIIQSKCLYFHKCGRCLLGLCVWLLKCKHDLPALHAAQKRQQPMGGGGEAENLQQLDFSTWGPNTRVDVLLVFKQSNFSFMIALHHPRLQLHRSALWISAVCTELCDGVRRPFLVLPPNQSFSLDAAAEHQKWLCFIDCSECFLIHFDKARLAAAAS